MFGVTWILLRKSSEDNISPATWKQFMVSRLYKLIHLFIFVEFDILHVCRLFAQSSRVGKWLPCAYEIGSSVSGFQFPLNH